MTKKEHNGKFARINEKNLESSLRKNTEACKKYMWTEYDGDESYWEELNKDSNKEEPEIEYDMNVKSAFEGENN